MEHTATAILAPPKPAQPDDTCLPGDTVVVTHSYRQPVVSPPDRREREGSTASRLASEGVAVAVSSFLVYLAAALLLDFKYESFMGDAFSRMANGFYIVYSRDPHLAAIGFVWCPLQSLVDLVFLLGNHVWPALAHNDMAGSLTSVFAMAGAVYQVNAALREWGVNRAPRLVLTAFFLLDPMIILYGGNGMSEALFLFTLTASTRYLLRWMDTGDLRSLAYAGVAMGFSYLTRNEAIGGVIAGALAVALVTYWRSGGGTSDRGKAALSDASIFAAPGIIAAAGWAIVSYVITGDLFGQYQSIYGNSEQQALASHLALHGRIVYELHAVTTMWPFLPIVLVAAVVVAIRRHDPRILAPLTVLGGALAFDALALLDNALQPYYRFFIATIPIEVLILGSLLIAVPSTPHEHGAGTSYSYAAKNLRNVGAVLLVLVAMVPAIVTTARSMVNTSIGPEESQMVAWVFLAHPNKYDVQYSQRYPAILKLSSYFDSLKLPDGDIIVDNSTDCVPEIITTSSQPKVFVIPNNRDFQRELADPLTFHAHYILEGNPSLQPNTAINDQYPTMWSTGAGFTERVRNFPPAERVRGFVSSRSSSIQIRWLDASNHRRLSSSGRVKHVARIEGLVRGLSSPRTKGSPRAATQP